MIFEAHEYDDGLTRTGFTMTVFADNMRQAVDRICERLGRFAWVGPSEEIVHTQGSSYAVIESRSQLAS